MDLVSAPIAGAPDPATVALADLMLAVDELTEISALHAAGAAGAAGSVSAVAYGAVYDEYLECVRVVADLAGADWCAALIRKREMADGG